MTDIHGSLAGYGEHTSLHGVNGMTHWRRLYDCMNRIGQFHYWSRIIQIRALSMIWFNACLTGAYGRMNSRSRR
jgi:hypothetical protein